jgi:hypothetical protein
MGVGAERERVKDGARKPGAHRFVAIGVVERERPVDARGGQAVGEREVGCIGDPAIGHSDGFEVG